MDRIKDDVQSIKTIAQEQASSSSNPQLVQHIEKMTKEVDELIQQGKFSHGLVLYDHESTRLPLVTTSLVGQSCTKNIKSITKLLKKDNVFAIGVQGMGGVGKTSLVKQIHNLLLSDPDISGPVYWVTASQDCSLEKLQIMIGKALGLDLSQEDNERKKASLFQKFTEKGKFVLIIDG